MKIRCAQLGVICVKKTLCRMFVEAIIGHAYPLLMFEHSNILGLYFLT